MAQEYRKVVEYLGHTVCCFMKREVVRAREDKIKIVYYLTDLLDCNPDAIIVAVSQKETKNILIDLLKYLLKQVIPILVEKPAAFTNNDFDEIMKWENSEYVKVGYNRRFYSGVNEIKTKINKCFPKSIYINLPEPIDMYNIYYLWEFPLHYSASHVIDLLFYFFNMDIRINYMDRIENCYVGILMIREIPVLFKAVFNSPEHTKMTFNFEGEVWSLCPIEELCIYDKLIKNENDGKYHMNIKMKIVEDRTFKPGLLEQVRQFLYFNEKDNLATLEDARRVSEFCNEIVTGVRC